MQMGQTLKLSRLKNSLTYLKTMTFPVSGWERGYEGEKIN